MATQSEAIYNQLFVHQKHLRINTPFPFGYFDSKQIQIDPLWSHCYLKPQKENKTMQQKWELTILKANRLGAAGFKVCGVEVQQDDFVLMTEPFSQAEIDEFSLKRSNILSNEKVALVNRIIQKRLEKGHTFEMESFNGKSTEDLSEKEIDQIISDYLKDNPIDA